MFARGFQMFRHKRKILDVPLSKMHSASVGLVEVMGTPTGPATLAAPVTGGPCFYYRVQAWQWQESGNSHSWKIALDESVYVPFCLRDETGQVLIDPKGADLDVHESFSDELGASYFATRDLLPENIKGFLLTRGLVPYDKIKIREHVIQPDYPLFIIGTLGENPACGSEINQSVAAQSARVRLGSRPEGAVNVGVHFQRKTAGSHPGIVEDARQMLTDAGLAPDAAFTDQVHTSVISTIETSPLNRGEQGRHCEVRAAIGKGERGDPFTISCRSPKEVVQSLAWKSTLYIWGGPILALTSLYLLLIFLESV
jgi:hypothetical protein